MFPKTLQNLGVHPGILLNGDRDGELMERVQIARKMRIVILMTFQKRTFKYLVVKNS